MFVDSLVTLKPLEINQIEQLQHQFEGQGDSKILVESASKLLSGLTQMAGVVMVPRRERVIFRQIEFLPLSGNRVLAILVTREGEVHNRIVETKKSYSASELQQAANLLNQHYAGEGLEEMHRRLVLDLRETKSDLERIMARALEMAEQVIDSSSGNDDYVMAGQTNLMGFSEFTQMDQLRELFDSFTEKHQLLQLLDASMQAKGVQLFIGEESGYKVLDQCTLVTAPYGADDQAAGVLGVVGPTRMAYDRVIPIVDITAKILGAALKSR